MYYTDSPVALNWLNGKLDQSQLAMRNCSKLNDSLWSSENFVSYTWLGFWDAIGKFLDKNLN